ncbi:hypothetical protein HYW75_00870 [Candidatus Pacearchaeota archaeon]|nr:hypothetical protein [Candidatus Pacearchaeota archaeon]
MELIGNALDILNVKGEFIGNLSIPGCLDEIMLVHNEERRARINYNDPFSVSSRNSPNFSTLVNNRKAKIRKTLIEMIKDVGLPGENNSRNRAMNQLVVQYICLDFRKHYDLLSNELFSLKRVIKTDSARIINTSYSSPKFAETKFEIPLFFGANLSETYSEFKASSEDNKYKYEIVIQSRTPPITKNAKENARQAYSRYYKAVSESLEDNEIGQFIHKNIESKLINMKLRMFWIPKSSELKIEATAIDKDPILVAELCNHPEYSGYRYLIDRWDVKGEIPYEHYLVEFTETKAGEK